MSAEIPTGAGPRYPSLRTSLGRLSYRLRDRLGLLPECNSVQFARTELARLRSGEPDGMQDAIERHILKMVREFSREGHSGMSASYAISILEKVLRFEPVTPLTGDDDEWVDISWEGHPWWQNKRCPHVFKDADGAYDGNGRVFVDPDGYAYTGSGSRVRITFPYVPKIEYVRRPRRGADGRFAPSERDQRSKAAA